MSLVSTQQKKNSEIGLIYFSVTFIFDIIKNQTSLLEKELQKRKEKKSI